MVLLTVILGMLCYFSIHPQYLHANTSDITADAQHYLGKININKRY